MNFRQSIPEDLPGIMEIIADAKQLLKSKHIDQWQNGYPNEEQMLTDIGQGCSYVLEDSGQIVGICTILTAPEPSYAKIYEGSWRTPENTRYATIHRLAVRACCCGSGCSDLLFSHAEKTAMSFGCTSIRVDTHEENLSMQRALARAGFVLCGKIYLLGGREDGDPRIALEKLL